MQKKCFNCTRWGSCKTAAPEIKDCKDFKPREIGDVKHVNVSK